MVYQQLQSYVSQTIYVLKTSTNREPHALEWTFPVNSLILQTFSFAFSTIDLPSTSSNPNPMRAMIVASSVLTLVSVPNFPLPCLRSGANNDGEEEIGGGRFALLDAGNVVAVDVAVFGEE